MTWGNAHANNPVINAIMINQVTYARTLSGRLAFKLKKK